MNLLDFLFVIFVVACYFLSSLRGGSKQIFSFLVIIVSFVIAGRFYGGVADVFPERVFPESFAGTFGFVVVYGVALGLLSFLGRFFDGIFKQIHFGAIDRFVSIIIGVIKGFVLSCMTLAVLVLNYPTDTPLLTDSFAGSYLFSGAEKAAKLLPRKERKEIAENGSELMRIWKDQRD